MKTTIDHLFQFSNFRRSTAGARAYDWQSAAGRALKLGTLRARSRTEELAAWMRNAAGALAKSGPQPSRFLDACKPGAKRSIDVVIAGTTLLLLAPLMIMVAILIRRSMGGPVFYMHPRVGQDGKMFNCIKFRTMATNGDEILARYLAANPEAAKEWRDTRKLRHDPRVTPVGQFLRKSSIDELPQLINVLRGEMSCVGPRPIVEEELTKRGRGGRSYVLVRPGLTGLWQVSGRNRLTERARVRFDNYYARKWSLWLDLQILFRTPAALLRFGDTS